MNQERLYQVILAPHISEKSARAAEHNQHVFRVATDATKYEVKKAVETAFDVKVDRVRIANVKGKTKGQGRLQGHRSDWRKAYVSLQEGQEIELSGLEG